MSRIEANECFLLDIEWYAVDQKGNVAVFCSAGEGNLPDFVCADRERTDALINYFEKSKKITETTLHFRSTNQAEEVAKNFSDKGLYYFDSDDGKEFGVSNLHSYYTKLSTPSEPLKYNVLPEYIKQILKNNLLEVEDFALVNLIQIKHAYD